LEITGIEQILTAPERKKKVEDTEQCMEKRKKISRVQYT